MAILKKLEDQLNCLICLDTYTNPKVLQCNHVYCQQCLVKLVVRDQQGELGLTCPSCRQVTPIPGNGVRGLQPAFRVNQLLEIVNEHKKIASASPEEVKSVSASSTPPASITDGCPEHGGKEVELYCETCGKTICWECIMKGSKHHSHEYDKLDKAFEKYNEEIKSSLKPLESQLRSVEKALGELNTRQDEISCQKAAIEADIHSIIARFHKSLDTKRTELISKLHKLTEAKLKSLAVQRDQIETTQAQLSSCLLFMKENLETDNQKQALLKKRTTVLQVKKLTDTFQPGKLNPNTEANMIFLKRTDFQTEIQRIGNVMTKSVTHCEDFTLPPSKTMNPKEALNSYCRRNELNPPLYNCSYPDDRVGYICTVTVDGITFSSNITTTKRAAEAIAAEKALHFFSNEVLYA